MNFSQLLLLVFIFSSCDEELLDLAREADDYPDAYIISGPISNSIITDNSVTFKYAGNNQLVSEFSHRIVNDNLIDSTWSNWSSDTIATYGYLDEGSS